jgi:hypothetical protein
MEKWKRISALIVRSCLLQKTVLLGANLGAGETGRPRRQLDRGNHFEEMAPGGMNLNELGRKWHVTNASICKALK